METALLPVGWDVFMQNLHIHLQFFLKVHLKLANM